MTPHCRGAPQPELLSSLIRLGGALEDLAFTSNGFQLPAVGQFGDEEAPTKVMVVDFSVVNGMILIYSHLNFFFFLAESAFEG